MDFYSDNMIHIDQISNPNKLLTHLHIHSKDLSAKVYPNLGGSLQEFVVNKVNIIDGISHDEAGLEDYANTYKSSILFPFPNRIKDGKYTFMDEAHQLPLNEPSVHNAIHGSVYNKEFTVSSIDTKENAATIVLTYASNGTLPGFPFAFELKLTYQISVSGQLVLKFDVLNTGNSPFPYGFGWHPYFLTEQLAADRLAFPSKEFYECDNRSIPVNTVSSPLSASFIMEDKLFDDAYSVHQGDCRFDSTRYQLHLNFGTTSEGYLQVYTPPNRKSIALEPMTCIANSFNTKIGLLELLPGTSSSWSIQMNVDTKS